MIPDIDFKYWESRNPFFGDSPILSNIKIGLNHSSKSGLIPDVINQLSSLKNSDLVSLIAIEIDACNRLKLSNGSALLRIFDLIQGWGGRMGKGPYVKPKNNPYRLTHFDEIERYYRAGISLLNIGKIDDALNELIKLKYVHTSFATKHIYFWSKYGPLQKSLPIFDKRIKLLIYGSNKPDNYQAYINELILKSEEINKDIEYIERALFAFSSNWFLNDKLICKEDPQHLHDEKAVAKILLREKSS